MIWVADDVPGDGARWVAEKIAGGAKSVALSGGSTPRLLYQRLAQLPVPWDAVDFFTGDERVVPPDHPDSNWGMAQAALPHARVHRMQVERPDAAERYTELLPGVLDVVLLGMGDDTHTASLFPGTDWSRATNAKVIATTSPKPPPARLSITPEVIRTARHVLVIVTGAAKAPQVKVALEGDIDLTKHPVQLARDATWLLDAAAAALVKGKRP